MTGVPLIWRSESATEKSASEGRKEGEGKPELVLRDLGPFFRLNPSPGFFAIASLLFALFLH